MLQPDGILARARPGRPRRARPPGRAEAEHPTLLQERQRVGQEPAWAEESCRLGR